MTGRRPNPPTPSAGRGSRVGGGIEMKAGYPSAPGSPKPPEPPAGGGPGAPPSKSPSGSS